MNIRLLPLLALASVLPAQRPLPVFPSTPVAGVAPKTPYYVDLAICLDISGSMDGLLNTARQNLWAVVNELATMRPTPTLRVALLTFGCSAHDAERGWVKVETGFTTDLDTVSQKLFALSTNGGEEYVARVVQTALEELQWSPGNEALRLLFVAGNEAATQDPKVEAAAMSRAAIQKGILVNAIYCGNPADELAPAWREVAKLADGQFTAIEKDAAVVITTPFDEQLAALSAAMNPTYVPYGAERAHWVGNQSAQDGNAVTLNPAAAAQRCMTKGSALYRNGHWDLVDACDDAKFKLEEVKKEDLPEALRALSIEQLRAHIAEQKQKRAEIRVQIEALGKQRESFVTAELKKLGGESDRLFEKVVIEAVRQQAEARGFQRQPAEPPPAAESTKPAAGDVESPFTQVVKAAGRDYRSFACVTGMPKVAPTDCRLPAPNVRRSAAEQEHGRKLYLLYARHAENGDYVQHGKPAVVGQTLVKEAWQCVEGAPQGRTESGARYLTTPTLREGDKVFHAGDAAGLFVMHKLAADTPGTDQGWVYGAIDRNGVVTAAGAVASCMRCHQGATEDRRFGLH
jgi:ribosomal protein L29